MEALINSVLPRKPSVACQIHDVSHGFVRKEKSHFFSFAADPLQDSNRSASPYKFDILPALKDEGSLRC